MAIQIRLGHRDIKRTLLYAAWVNFAEEYLDTYSPVRVYVIASDRTEPTDEIWNMTGGQCTELSDGEKEPLEDLIRAAWTMWHVENQSSCFSRYRPPCQR